MDLISVVMVLDLPGDENRASEKLAVWRRNGQLAFSWDAPFGTGIPFARWKMDGRLMALGTSDGMVRLLNVMNGGKIVHCLAPVRGEPSSTPDLLHLSWAVSFGDVCGVRNLVRDADCGLAVDDLLSLSGGMESISKMKADLPRELACGIDVETSIPKLSTLPPGTGAGNTLEFDGDDDVFSTRASIDAIFHTQNSISTRSLRHDEVDVLLTGFPNGIVHIRIFECFDVGKIDLTSSLSPDTKDCVVLQHIAHPLCSTHALAVQTSTSNRQRRLHILALHLNFVPRTSPHYLSTVAAKSTQLINLLRYLAQVSLHLSIELRGVFDLPGRFIGNINVSLGQSSDGPTDFLTSAYQLIVAGDCGDELRDWMIDQIGDRNLKRWEKASLHGMETIRRLVHECLLPAVERSQAVLSRLKGLSRFSKSAHAVGLDQQSLDRVTDTIECLNLLSHHLLKTVGKEIVQFSAFMKWLKLEVEIQGLQKENAGGAGSERLEELCMRRDEVETTTVLHYIHMVMGDSGMTAFVRPSLDARGIQLHGHPYDWAQSQVNLGFYEMFKKMLTANAGPVQRPRLDDLLRRLQGQAQRVFQGIAQTLRKSIMHQKFDVLHSASSDYVFSAILAPASIGDQHAVVVVFRSESRKDQLIVQRIMLKAANASQQSKVKTLTVPGGASIREMKFVDETELMVLSLGNDSAFLHSIDCTATVAHWQERYTFRLTGGVDCPSDLDINGRKGMRAVCLMEGDRKFTVLDLEGEQAMDDEPSHDEDMAID